MDKDKKEVKQMVFIFNGDGSVRRIWDGEILDEPFMGIVTNTLNELADIWFEFVMDSGKVAEKVKPFGIIVRI